MKKRKIAAVTIPLIAFIVILIFVLANIVFPTPTRWLSQDITNIKNVEVYSTKNGGQNLTNKEEINEIMEVLEPIKVKDTIENQEDLSDDERDLSDNGYMLYITYSDGSIDELRYSFEHNGLEKHEVSQYRIIRGEYSEDLRNMLSATVSSKNKNVWLRRNIEEFAFVKIYEGSTEFASAIRDKNDIKKLYNLVENSEVEKTLEGKPTAEEFVSDTFWLPYIEISFIDNRGNGEVLLLNKNGYGIERIDNVDLVVGSRNKELYKFITNNLEKHGVPAEDLA